MRCFLHVEVSADVLIRQVCDVVEFARVRWARRLGQPADDFDFIAGMRAFPFPGHIESNKTADRQPVVLSSQFFDSKYAMSLLWPLERLKRVSFWLPGNDRFFFDG